MPPPLWNQLEAPLCSSPPYKDLRVLDVGPSMTFTSLLAEDSAERVKWLSDSSNSCLLENPNSQAVLQMLDWDYSTGPHQVLFVLLGTNTGKLSNAFFVYLFVLLWKKLQEGTSSTLFSGSNCSKIKALQTDLSKAFCCVFSSLYHWLVRSTLTSLFLSYLCTSHSHP